MQCARLAHCTTVKVLDRDEAKAVRNIDLPTTSAAFDQGLIVVC